MSRTRLFFCVLLPFAAGYFLSYVFRTINALIASDLASEFGLGAADLGLLTSVYFLVFAAVQLPLGGLLDRYGPATIQSALLLVASTGALIFTFADGLTALLVGRAFLALGVAVALMSGFKAIALWFPPHRIAFANGWLVMLGALGAVAASAPAEWVVQAIGWRGLFALLGALSALAALVILIAAPSQSLQPRPDRTLLSINVWDIYRDRRFWRLAPLSAIGIGTSWSLQGLWAAPWLRDVEGFDRVDVVQNLGLMAGAVCAGAFVLGTIATRLRRLGMKTEALLAATVLASMGAQAALVLRWPLPSWLLWSTIAAAGAGTVLSFAILGEYFPKEVSGRANAALNLLHVGGAFILQSATGLIIAQWPEANGAYPAQAHQTAMCAVLLLQLMALAWFALSSIAGRKFGIVGGPLVPARYPIAAGGYIALKPRQKTNEHKHISGWRLAATASGVLLVALTGVLSITISRPAVAVQILEINTSASILRFAAGI